MDASTVFNLKFQFLIKLFYRTSSLLQHVNIKFHSNQIIVIARSHSFIPDIGIPSVRPSVRPYNTTDVRTIDFINFRYKSATSD